MPGNCARVVPSRADPGFVGQCLCATFRAPLRRPRSDLPRAAPPLRALGRGPPRDVTRAARRRPRAPTSRGASRQRRAGGACDSRRRGLVPRREHAPRRAVTSPPSRDAGHHRPRRATRQGRRLSLPRGPRRRPRGAASQGTACGGAAARYVPSCGELWRLLRTSTHPPSSGRITANWRVRANYLGWPGIGTRRRRGSLVTT